MNTQRLALVLTLVNLIILVSILAHGAGSIVKLTNKDGSEKVVEP